MGLTRTIPPATEPVSLADVATHLRLDSSNAQPHPTAPTVALIDPAAAGNVDNGAHRYRVTFVTSAGETDGGDISAPVTVVDKTVNGKVSLTAIQLGGSGVTSRKIYRTLAGGSTYFLLATIADNTTTIYTDNTADSGLGAGVPAANGTVDPELVSLIATARGWAEGITHRALVTQTWRLTLDEFPCLHHRYDHLLSRMHPWNAQRAVAIEVPWPNLLTVTTLKYIDTTGTEQTMDAATYAADTDSLPGRVMPAYGTSWPAARCQPNAVTLTYTAGYGAATAVPDEIKRAMLLQIGDWYRNREAQTVGAMSENPAALNLLGQFVYREAV